MHQSYFEINAKTYYELGFQKGKLFSESLRETIKEYKKNFSWNLLQELCQYNLDITIKNFPYLIEELNGYADGAKIPFDELWVCINEELFESALDRCTTIITNNGLLIAHNEDWNENAKDSICVLKKTIGGLTILELFYNNTLGGNSISINSNGFIQAVNSLNPSEAQIGIPRDIIARWLSETNSLEDDYKNLCKMKRASGYNHVIVNKNGKINDIECSAKNQILTEPESPFVHTNHFLTNLCSRQNDNDNYGTYERYNYAVSKINKSITVEMIKELMRDTSQGPESSLFNSMTIAQVVVDLEKFKAHIWLLSEKERGWIQYNLDFMKINRAK